MIAIAMLPADYWAGVADWMPAHSTATTPMREVLGQAMRNQPLLVMPGVQKRNLLPRRRRFDLHGAIGEFFNNLLE
jgi:hypothetical protein